MEEPSVVVVALGVATVTLSIASAIIGGVTVIWKMTSKFITYEHCNESRCSCDTLRQEKATNVNKEFSAMCDDVREIKASNEVQYYMLRSLVIHSPNLTPEQQAKILNGGNGKR